MPGLPPQDSSPAAPPLKSEQAPLAHDVTYRQPDDTARFPDEIQKVDADRRTEDSWRPEEVRQPEEIRQPEEARQPVEARQPEPDNYVAPRLAAIVEPPLPPVITEHQQTITRSEPPAQVLSVNAPQSAPININVALKESGLEMVETRHAAPGELQAEPQFTPVKRQRRAPREEINQPLMQVETKNNPPA